MLTDAERLQLEIIERSHCSDGDYLALTCMVRALDHETILLRERLDGYKELQELVKEKGYGLAEKSFDN